MRKKLISLFLSVVLLLSCCSVAFVAFAEEAAMDDLTETVTERTETDATGNSATAADKNVTALLETYMALCAAESNLNAEQRANLEAAQQKINTFSENFAGLSSEQVATQASEILATLAGKFSKKTGPVGELENKIAAYEGKMNTAAPTDEDLAGYNEIVTAYNNLTDTQKGELDIFMFDKMFHLVLDREYQLAKANGEATKVAYATAQKNAVTVLGNVGFAACFDEAAALYNTVNSTKLSAQEKLDAFAAASENARMYSSLWYPSYNCMYYKMDSSTVTKSFWTIAQAFEKELVKNDPFTETAPTKVNKPNAKDYADGENDPAYQEAFLKYMAYQKENAEYNCRKANHTSNYDLQGMEKIAAVAPEFAAVVKLAKDAMAAVDAFNANSSNLAPAKKVIADFEKLTAYQQAIIEKGSSVKLRTVPKESTSSWSTTSMYLNTFYNNCIDIAQYDKLTAFLAVMDSIEPPYTNDDIVKAKDAYNEVPSSLRANIPEEVQQKYKDILASIAPDTPSLLEPDLAIFKETVVNYPEDVTRAQVEKALPRMETLLTDVLLPILGMDGGLPELVETGLYTNYTVTEVCKLLFPLLASLIEMEGFPGMAAGFVKIKPSKLAGCLNEPEDAGKFAGAIAALNNAETAGQAAYDQYIAQGGEANDVKLYEMYWTTDFTVQNGDWGFQDGDREGFLDAVSAVFRAVSVVTMLIDLENSISTTNGTYTYGAYEDLVPVFEALDLDGYMSSHEYTLYVKEVSAQNSKLAMDARVRPILVPIFNLIDQFAEAPLDTLLDVLPKLGWAVKSDLLNDQIGALTSKLGFGLGESVHLDLTAEGLYNMLAPMLESLTIGDTTLSIKLDKENFVQFINDIGGCGTAVVKNSKARGTAYRLGVDSDKPDAFVVLFRWLYGEMTTDENMNSIKSVVNASDLGTVPKLIIKIALNRIAQTPTETALAALINLAAPTAPNNELPGIGDLRPGGSDDGNDKNQEESGKPITDNPSVPKTGGQITTALFSLALTASVVGIAIAKRKADETE